jgi:hypothetical protein
MEEMLRGSRTLGSMRDGVQDGLWEIADDEEA